MDKAHKKKLLHRDFMHSMKNAMFLAEIIQKPEIIKYLNDALSNYELMEALDEESIHDTTRPE